MATSKWPDDHPNARILLLVESSRQVISRVPSGPLVDGAAEMLDRIEALIDQQWLARTRTEIEALVAQVDPLVNEAVERMNGIRAQLLEAQQRAAENLRNAAQSIRLPSVVLSGSFSSVGLYPSEPWVPVFQVTLGVKVPLFTGGLVMHYGAEKIGCLVIPAGLATGATAETIDVVTEQTGAPWDVAPAHLQLTFQGYVLPASFHVPQLFVYPAEQYAFLNASAAESRRRLQAVLANPTAHYENDAVPHVPFFNAAQVFVAQQKVLRLSGAAAGDHLLFHCFIERDVGAPETIDGLFRVSDYKQLAWNWSYISPVCL